jgi:hypothetical protein
MLKAQLFPFAKYGEQARKVLETLLDKYVRWRSRKYWKTLMYYALSHLILPAYEIVNAVSLAVNQVL